MTAGINRLNLRYKHRLACCFLWGICFAIPCHLSAGEYFIVDPEGASLKVEAATVGSLVFGTKVVATDENGEWIWVTSDGKEGWVDRSKTVSAESAIDFITARINSGDPKDFKWYFLRGIVYASQLKYSAGIEDYTEALRLAPDVIKPRLYNDRGVLWAEKGEYQIAIADYSDAIRLNPSIAAIYMNRGTAWKYKGEYTKAISDYSESLRLDPGLSKALYRRGQAYTEFKQFEKAEADFSEIIRKAPTDRDALYERAYARMMLADSVSEGDRDRYLKMAVNDVTNSMYTGSPALWLKLRGRLWLKLREYDKAVADCTAAILDGEKLERDFQSLPENLRKEVTFWKNNIRTPLLYQMRADAFFELGRFEEAVTDLGTALQIDPKYIPAYRKRSMIYRLQGNSSLLLADYERILELSDKKETWIEDQISFIRNNEIPASIGVFLKHISGQGAEVMRIIPYSSADGDNRIEIGDVIVAIREPGKSDWVPLENLSIAKIVRQIGGPNNSSIQIKLRKSSGQTDVRTVVRRYLRNSKPVDSENDRMQYQIFKYEVLKQTS